MSKRSRERSGSAVLRPKARILHTLGDELISSETVAVIELVKNAYDADASRVMIRFAPEADMREGLIEVMDDGHGMSLDTLLSAWMEPATLARKRKPRSEGLGRRVLGEKGIGRFAASRLGSTLEVVTRRVDMDLEVWAFFDWREFEDETKYLDEVQVRWQQVEPSEICAGGSIEKLWGGDSAAGRQGPRHGTILRVGGLRSTWGIDELETLRTGLSRLISPFYGEKRVREDDKFQIWLHAPEPYSHLSGIVEPPEALMHPHYLLKGTIDANAEFDLTLRLRDRRKHEKLTGRFTLSSGETPRCGPIRVELRVWDRDQTSLSQMARDYGSTLRDVRRDLDQAAGINIYRDGFRVLSYGEPTNDWLRLDLRRVQNPTLRLSNNQIVGYVLIGADSNPRLRDQSNREGLTEGPALHDLRELAVSALAELEQRRYAARRESRRTARKAEAKTEALFTGFDLIAIREHVAHRYPGDDRLLSIVDQGETQLREKVERIQQVLARYHRLATLGQLIDTVLHDARAPLGKIRNEAHLAAREILGKNTAGRDVLNRLQSSLGAVNKQCEALAAVFRKIEPFGGRTRGRPSEARLERLIADAFSVLDTEIVEVGARIALPDSDTRVTVDEAEIQEVIINLLQNSLYWLRTVPQESRAIRVEVGRKSPEEVEILFSDSGPGVAPEFRERIFDPYFSTKPDGVGLGLSIAGEIITDFYGGELALVEGGSLGGATFLIKLRKRV